MNFVHLPLPKGCGADVCQAEGLRELDVPLCMIFAVSEIEDLGTFLKIVRALRHDRGTRQWQLDERLLFARRKEMAVVVDGALTALESGQVAPLVGLVRECPTVLVVFPRVAGALADMVAHREADFFKILGAELARRKRSSAKGPARELVDRKAAIQEEARLVGKSVDTKELLITLHGGDTLERRDVERIRSALSSASRAAVHVVFRAMGCAAHDGADGLQPGPGPGDERAERRFLWREDKTVAVSKERTDADGGGEDAT